MTAQHHIVRKHYQCEGTVLFVLFFYIDSMFSWFVQGSHAAWSPGFFSFKIPGPGKSWIITLVLESPGKIAATRCHILRSKCTKFNFGWGSAPDPVLGELTALPQIPLLPWLDLKSPTSKGRKEEGGQGSGGEGRVFSKLYLSTHGIQKGPGKFLMGSWEVQDFLSVQLYWLPRSRRGSRCRAF